jgi:hypothetical protein
MLATFSAMPWDWVSKDSIELLSSWEMSTPLDMDPEEVPVVEETVGDCNMSDLSIYERSIFGFGITITSSWFVILRCG